MNFRFFGYIAVFILLVQITGCSSTVDHRYAVANDYAPGFQVDASKVSDAVPKVEPYSKYGNPSSYVACGHRYYVMHSSRGYCERGIASWYGMKFHKVRTSSGEIYDICKMTAAHKTLPLPTYCLVTNLKTGKHVIVKVNDRGPFVANRIIDLSYVAAIKLGVTAHGTALVEVRAIDPRNNLAVSSKPSRAVQVPIKGRPRLYLQMGAFTLLPNAQNVADKVKACVSYPVFILRSGSPGKSIYKVQIGPLPSVEESDKVFDQLQSSGIGKPLAVVN